MRKLLITLLILGVLLVAADIGARAYAESRTADAVQNEMGMTKAPDVSIEGFPFLLHAIRGEYPQVVMSATGLDEAVLPGTGAVLNLSDVTIPLRDALAGDTSRLAASATNLKVSIPLSSLAAALGRPDLTLTEGPGGSLVVSTTVNVVGQRFPVSGTATISVANETLTLSVTSLQAAGVDLTPLAQSAASSLASQLTASFPLTGLPFSVTTADVTVSAGDVVLSVSTGAVTLNQLR